MCVRLVQFLHLRIVMRNSTEVQKHTLLQLLHFMIRNIFNYRSIIDRLRGKDSQIKLKHIRYYHKTIPLFSSFFIMFNSWATISLDSEVLTKIAQELGAPGVQVQKIYSLEEDNLFTGPSSQIYAYIFTSKWSKSLEKKDFLTIYDEELFFARQVVNELNPTLTLLTTLLNSPVKLEKQLFREFKDQSCEERGLAISNSEAIRQLHNKFGSDMQDEVNPNYYHSVCYVPHKGNLYELDGLQAGPILIGRYQNDQDWLELARSDLKRRVKASLEKDVEPSIFCLRRSQQWFLGQQIAKLSVLRSKIHNNLKRLGYVYNIEFVNDSLINDDDEKDEQKLGSQLKVIDQKITQLQQKNQELRQIEATRRRQIEKSSYDYSSIFIQMLKILARKKKVAQLIDRNIRKF